MNFTSGLVSQTLGSNPNYLVQDFAVIMIVAAIMLVVTFKLKQPMVIGYLLAGMVIGPYTPPFRLIHDINALNVLAELGIIMLMFVIGTEFPIAKLRISWKDFDYCRALRITRNSYIGIFCSQDTGVFTVRLYVSSIGHVCNKYGCDSSRYLKSLTC